MHGWGEMFGGCVNGVLGHTKALEVSFEEKRRAIVPWVWKLVYASGMAWYGT